MPLAEVLSDARTLSRPEQLALIRELASGLLGDELPVALIEPGRDYPAWSPDAAYGAAAALLQALEQPKVGS